MGYVEVKDKKVLKVFADRQAAAQRAEMAQQTLNGATAALLDAEGRLKGVAEYVFGVEFTLKLDGNKLLVDLHGNPAGSNGHTTMTPVQLNRAARRALAKGKKP